VAKAWRKVFAKAKPENGVKVLEVDCRTAEHLKLAIAGGAPTDSGDG
jgi:hypothetical protein